MKSPGKTRHCKGIWGKSISNLENFELSVKTEHRNATWNKVTAEMLHNIAYNVSVNIYIINHSNKKNT